MLNGSPLAAATAPDAEPRSVLGRAFDVLACFAAAPERGVTEICAATGLPAATVHRLLGTLGEQGVVEKCGWGRYRLGPRLWRLGHGVPVMDGLRDAARPVLVDLHAATDLPVALGVLDQDRLRVVDKIAGRRAMPVCEQLGRPLLADHPGGEVLLAWGTAEGLTPERRATIRSHGFAASTEATDPLLWVAAPVPGPGAAVAVTAMICGQRGQHGPEVLGRTIRTAAARIAAGWTRLDQGEGER